MNLGFTHTLLTISEDSNQQERRRIAPPVKNARSAGAGLKMSLEKSLLRKGQLSVIPQMMDAYQSARQVERSRNKELITFFEEYINTNHPHKRPDDFDSADESNCTDDGVYKYVSLCL